LKTCVILDGLLRPTQALFPKTEIDIGWQAEKALSAALGADIKGVSPNTLFNRQGDRMVRQTVLPFTLERTDETLTAHGGLALQAEFNHGLGLCALVDRYVPGPGSNRGYAPSVFVDRLILMLQAGGRSLEDLRELRREAGLLRLLDRAALPDPDTLGDWLRRRALRRRSTPGWWGWGRCGMS